MVLRHLLLAILILAIAGCTTHPPECPDTGEQTSVKSAGCIVIDNGRLLVIREMSGKISIPGGSGNSDETPRCSAHRETWEETGLNTVPEQLVRRFDNGFHLFHCNLHPDSGKIDPEFTHEVREAFWLGAEQFDRYEWRFPDQKGWLKKYLQKRQ